MRRVAFDVNDPCLREAFLRQVLPEALGTLDGDRPPRWGKMTAQQMVEHLEWAFALSDGRGSPECPISAAELDRRKAFLYNNRPTPQGFMNPLLTAGLPRLRHGGLEEARTALATEVDRFLAQSSAASAAMRTHPVFGPITLEEWGRSHYKHAWHHLLQFGLIRLPDDTEK